jgi:hypothetical protein
MRNNEHKPKKERDARVKERRRTILVSGGYPRLRWEDALAMRQ